MALIVQHTVHMFACFGRGIKLQLSILFRTQNMFFLFFWFYCIVIVRDVIKIHNFSLYGCRVKALEGVTWHRDAERRGGELVFPLLLEWVEWGVQGIRHPFVSPVLWYDAALNEQRPITRRCIWKEERDVASSLPLPPTSDDVHFRRDTQGKETVPWTPMWRKCFYRTVFTKRLTEGSLRGERDGEVKDK